MKQVYFALLFNCLWMGTLQAVVVRSDHAEAELVSEINGIQAGERFWMALRLKTDPSWHSYWLNPGEVGLPTELEWTELPEGFEVGSFHWPPPKRYLQQDIMNYVYEGQVLLLFEVVAPEDLDLGTQIVFKARADWLACDPSMCVPGGADLSVSLPVLETEPEWSRWHDVFEATRDSWSKDLSENWSVRADRTQDGYRLTMTPKAGGNRDPGTLYFYSSAAQVAPSTQQTFEQVGGAYQLLLEREPLNNEVSAVSSTTPPVPLGLEHLPGDLFASEGWLEDGRAPFMMINPVIDEAATTTGESTEASALTEPLELLPLLGLALVGGLILNLMPCVFPVLGLKLMSFVKQAEETRARVVMHGLVFTGGVLISFWILAGILIALRMGGQALGWGFQLQEPGFVLILTVILLIFGLNLSGLFEVGGSAIGVGSQLTGKRGVVGTFFSGVLATVVATPCAAPFLAPALGGALTLPPLQAIWVFTAMGLGLSAPYLLLSLFPGLVKCLPRPGAWMETFKQFMAFFLYGTVAYLIWVLAAQVEGGTLLLILGSLVLVSMGCWIYGRWGAPHRKRGVQWTARFIALALVGLPLVKVYGDFRQAAHEKALIQKIALGEAEQDFLIWEPWSSEKEAQLRAEGRFVYVDFTARWCATCQVNKRAYSNREVIQAFLRNDVALLKADWTEQDPAITQALAEYQRMAVPFNLIYTPKQSKPVILPELITPGIILEKLREAGAE